MINRSAKRGSQLSICKNPKHRATICDPKLRTMNTDAPCHSDLDFYQVRRLLVVLLLLVLLLLLLWMLLTLLLLLLLQFAPWRAPGAAPVIDSCGVAGGVHKGEGPAAAGGDYQNTSNAKLGDFGSRLPPLLGVGTTVWSAGEVVEVAWTQKAYHGVRTMLPLLLLLLLVVLLPVAVVLLLLVVLTVLLVLPLLPPPPMRVLTSLLLQGGYQYRLCPLGSTLNEECFFKTPVPFADHTSVLRWGGVGSRQISFNATEVKNIQGSRL